MRKRNGFTLVELLVVVGIIGILSGLVIVALKPATYFKQGRDSRRLSDLTTIQSALEQYFAQNGKYPTDVPASPPAWTQVVGGSTITYLKSVPKDPNSTTEYKYCPDDATTPQNYQICANMEGAPKPSSDCVTGSYTLNDNCTINTTCCLTNPF